jgi:hypothetical protein
MSVEIFQEENVLIVVLIGAVSQADIRLSADKFHALCNSTSQAVHVIADASKLASFPPDILALLKTLVVPAYPSNTGTIVIVTRNTVIEKITMFLCHLLPTAAIQIVRNIDDARDHIRQLRQIEPCES